MLARDIGGLVVIGAGGSAEASETVTAIRQPRTETGTRKRRALGMKVILAFFW